LQGFLTQKSWLDLLQKKALTSEFMKGTAPNGFRHQGPYESRRTGRGIFPGAGSQQGTTPYHFETADTLGD
jgi:hypothetical protein